MLIQEFDYFGKNYCDMIRFLAKFTAIKSEENNKEYAGNCTVPAYNAMGIWPTLYISMC